MSQSTALENVVPEQRAIARVKPEVIAKIDEVAAGALDIFKAKGSFALELRMAEAIGDLRAALTPEVMAPIMALQGSSLGFRTDRDGGTSYPVEVVRDCFIQAKLRGYRAIGNEFNIIGGNFFAAKNGIRRKLLDTPGFTDYKPGLEPPKMATSGEGAIVKARATWKIDGIADSLEQDIPIRVNKGQGADAILGKAVRRLDALVLARLEGVTTPEAEVGDDIVNVEAPNRVTAPPPTTAQAQLAQKLAVDAMAQADATAAAQAAALPPKKQEQQFDDLIKSLAAEFSAEFKAAKTPSVLNDVVTRATAANRAGKFTDEEFRGLRVDYDEALVRVKASSAT